jgi:hypothetical protein
MGEDTMPESPPSRDTAQWQRRTLPLMMRMLVGLTVFFFLASCIQLVYLHIEILRTPTLDVTPAFTPLNTGAPLKHQEMLAEARLRALILLETSTLDRHYHQASALVLARVWKNYLGFVTGMILALVGAAFVLGKLEGPAAEMSGKGAPGELSFKSASPGLMLAVMGVILMLTTLVINADITVRNSAVYLRATDEVPATPPDSNTAPPLDRPPDSNAAHSVTPPLERPH